MDVNLQSIYSVTPAMIAAAVAAVAAAMGILVLYRRRPPNSPPVVPGIPLLGNLLQLKESKPYHILAKWAEVYGPIYSIKLGSSSTVILNSTELSKEALVTRFSSISTRKLSNALETITGKEIIVACDYGEYHKMAKKHLISAVLGTNAQEVLEYQKRNRPHRDCMMDNVVAKLSAKINDDDCGLVEIREIFQLELFQLALKQSLGRDVGSIYVEELGATISKKEMIDILVLDPLIRVLEIDWRDFFPYLRWIPNRSMEMRIRQTATRKRAVTKALIDEKREQIAHEEEPRCYLDYLLSESALTEEQVIALVWEAIIETSDPPMVATEWAMYEIAKNPTKQNRIYQEIQNVCGSEKIKEEDLQHLRYLNAAFHETLRLYPPVPMTLPSHVHEDTQLGGYNIPAGTDICVNLYACNMNEKDWKEPKEWRPERFLSDEYEQMDMYKTMSFACGKRVCTGSLQAMLIACTAIGRLVQEFEWKLKEGDGDDVDTLGITMHKLHPVQAYIRPRGRCGSVQKYT
ncbi:ent-kaurene oxidase 2-like [Phalaenopsis equestris]|uniref:ent-kaurene oxidase 2-like n=1 Tax=Phalaenopsis equestris TaxID=78828 RepID=UPI0009E41B83|nr:ent-kaurene oxidase 2-like [Phalaenopsis equestris]